MAYLVARGHSPIKVKRAVKNVGKMTRAKVKKQIIANKNAIIFPARHNPRITDVNAIIKNMNVLQNSTVLNELFSTNSFIVVNKRVKNLCKLVIQTACRSMQHKIGSFRSN